jgi:hypothetical protein
MASHFSRKIYDNCYSIEFIDQQVDPCKYKTNDIYGISKLPCHSLNGPRANKARSTGELGDSVYQDRVEIESMLFNLDVPDSKIISLNTMKEKNERLAKIAGKKKVNYTDCDKSQDYTYSRLDIPVNNFRSVEIPRWEFPIIDPKEWVYYGYDKSEQVGNQRFGVNTQIAAKDKISKQNMRPFSVIINK